MHESFEMWLKEHKEDLMKAFNGGYCMPGEMPPFRNMTWEVFTLGRWEQESRAARRNVP